MAKPKAEQGQGQVVIPAKNIVQRIGEKSGPIAGAGVAKRGYGDIKTKNKGS